MACTHKGEETPRDTTACSTVKETTSRSGKYTQLVCSVRADTCSMRHQERDLRVIVCTPHEIDLRGMAHKRDLQGMAASDKHLSMQCRERCLAILSAVSGPGLHCNHTNVGQLHCGASKAADAIFICSYLLGQSSCDGYLCSMPSCAGDLCSVV